MVADVTNVVGYAHVVGDRQGHIVMTTPALTIGVADGLAAAGFAVTEIPDPGDDVAVRVLRSRAVEINPGAGFSTVGAVGIGQRWLIARRIRRG